MRAVARSGRADRRPHQLPLVAPDGMRFRIPFTRIPYHFSIVLHEETDLGALNAELAWVGREPMQPAHVSLRLRPATSPKDCGGRGYQIDERGKQTYAFCFRWLPE